MILRTRPFTPAFDQRVDRMFAELTRSLHANRTPTVDAAWVDGQLRLTLDVPGTPEEAIAVEVAGRTLSISVDHEGSAWTRSVRLGAQLDPTQVAAHYAHGRLTITVAPIAEPEKRRVAIETNPAPRAVTESTATDEPADESLEAEPA